MGETVVEVAVEEAEARYERWRRLYEDEKWSCGQIALAEDVTRQAVSERLRKMGVEMRGQHGPPVQRALILELARDRGAALSLPEIVKTVGNSWNVVKRIIEDAGLLDEVRSRSKKRILKERSERHGGS